MASSAPCSSLPRQTREKAFRRMRLTGLHTTPASFTSCAMSEAASLFSSFSKAEEAGKETCGDDCKEAYDEASDVEFGEDEFLSALPDTELEEKLRQIGEAGEQYANRQLIRHFLEEGYQIREENAHLCRLENEHTGQTAEVCRPDSNHYHQAGWDIAVRKTKKTEGESPSEEQTDYYEVKTCTMHSRYRNLLRISNEPFFKFFENTDKDLYIADKVGVGKTIETGIILSELVYGNRNNKWIQESLKDVLSPRILILAPPALCAQWKEELEDKFMLSVYDAYSGKFGRMVTA